jgi:diguanylate cyclase (GGDEF)-like protein
MIELLLVAGTPLLYDDRALENAYLPRYLALSAGFLAVTGVMLRVKRRLVEAERSQREIAHRDALTGIPNRRAFDSALRCELGARTGPAGGRRGADAEPLALLILDLDDFKSINDVHGHQIGDAVLRDAAERMAGVLRGSDMLARIGGDEFAVIVPSADSAQAQLLAEKAGAAVATREPGSSMPAPRASVGWAVYPDDGESYETLMRSADERLLALKHGSGRPFSHPIVVRKAMNRVP